MQNGSLLKQFSKRKPCYYCGAPPPSSKEHAPAKLIFEAFDCDRITVPSCDIHNSEKNLKDRAVATAFLRGLYFGLRNASLTPNQLEALDVTQEKIGEAREVTLKPLVHDPLGELDVQLPHIDETKILHDWMRQLTAALVWSVSGEYDPSIHWEDALVWSPDYVPDESIPDPGIIDIRDTNSVSIFEESMAKKSNVDQFCDPWWSGWSSFPRRYPRDIYYFDVCLSPSQEFANSEDGIDIVFRHRFYGQYSWYVFFATSGVTVNSINEALQIVNQN